jgi:peroxiredoxin Q/BCP
MLEVGSEAPRFIALNQDGREIRLQDYLDKNDVVLYFFPKASTPG